MQKRNFLPRFAFFVNIPAEMATNDEREQRLYYHDQCTFGLDALYQNRRFYDDFLDDTLPDGKLPTHGKALSVTAAKTVAVKMLTDLMQDIFANSRKAWEVGSKLEAPNGYRQPLADSKQRGMPDDWT